MNLRCAVLAAAFAAPALAEEHVLFEVQGKDTLTGSVRPADEREAILCRMGRGSVLKAAVKSIDKAGPAPSLELLESDALVEGVGISAKGRGAVLAPFAVPKTGLYKLVVLGDGALDGDYQVSLSWKPQKKFAGTGTTAGDDTFVFAAPPSSVVSITLAAANGSAFVPNLLELAGPQPADVIALPGGGSAKGVTLTRRGDWTVRFRNDGGAGDYVVSVKIAAPAPKKHTFDLRDGTLAGNFGGGNTVNGAVIDPGLGGLVEVTDGGSPIAGSSVSIPPGALGETTSIFVAQTKPYVPPGGDLPAGPAVEFGPAGTQFDASNPATVTIPYEPNAFPGGTSALVVYVKSADGTIEPVLPTSSYVFGANTVSFTTSHFSAFQAATTAPRGPLSGEYLMIEAFGSPEFNLNSNCGVGQSQAFFNGSGGVQLLTDRTKLHILSGFDREPGTPPSVELEDANDFIAGTTTQIGDSEFLMNDETGSPLGRLHRGISQDVLVLDHVEGSLGLSSAFLIRRLGDARPTLNALAGKWNVLVWELSGNQPDAGDLNLPLFITAETGSVTILPTGAITFKMAGGVKRFSDFPGGVWNTEAFAKRQATGQLSISPDFFPELSFGNPDSTVAFSVSNSGDVLVGKMRNFDRGFGAAGAQTGLILLVRETAGASARDFGGLYAEVMNGVDLTPPPGDAADLLGVTWRAESGTALFADDATYDRTFLECTSRFIGAEPTPNSQQGPDGAPIPFTVSPTGIFAAPQLGLQGAASPERNFVFYVRRGPPTMGLGFMLLVPPGRP